MLETFQDVETGLTKSGEKLYVVSRIECDYEDHTSTALYATTDRLLADKMVEYWSAKIKVAEDTAKAARENNAAIRNRLHELRSAFPTDAAFKEALTAIHQACYKFEHNDLLGTEYVVHEIEMVTTISSTP